MSEDVAAQRSPKKGRSPSYPAIDLQAAIKRVETLYSHEKMHPAPIGAIVSHWGYTSHKSGIASVQYASLKKFGLLTEEGSGENRLGKLTQLAFAILHNPDEAERANAIKTAALTPGIHRELWDQYGLDLPSDANLRYRLVTERGFTDAGAEDFVKEYKATLDFAMTGPADEPDDDNEAEGPADEVAPSSAAQGVGGAMEPQSNIPVHPRAAANSRTSRHAIPLVGGKQVILEGEFPLTEAAWAGFLAVLEAFKPGLVEAAALPEVREE